MEREIIIDYLDTGHWKRGPGGNWFRYRAAYADDPKGVAGYGGTAREARLDLQKQHDNVTILSGG